MNSIAAQRAREVATLTGQVRVVLSETTTRAARRTLAATVDRLAACAGDQSGRWFPAQGGAGLADVIAVCESCPVRARCLALELATVESAEDIHGVRGGLTEAEARRVFRQLTATVPTVGRAALGVAA